MEKFGERARGHVETKDELLATLSLLEKNGRGKSEYANEVRGLIAAIDSKVADAMNRAALADGERIAAERSLALQELKHKMLREPVAFKTSWPENAGTPEQIQAAIQRAYDEFSKQVSADDATFIARVMSVSYNNPIDSTSVNDWLALHEWCNAQFEAIEQIYVSPEPILEPLSDQEQHIAALEAAVESTPPRSRERSQAELKLLRANVSFELQNGSLGQILRQIVEESGKSLSSKHQQEFVNYVKMRHVDDDETSIRLAFSEWAGDNSFLNDTDRAELERRRTVAGMSSLDVAKIVGTRSGDIGGYRRRAPVR